MKKKGSKPLKRVKYVIRKGKRVRADKASTRGSKGRGKR